MGRVTPDGAIRRLQIDDLAAFSDLSESRGWGRPSTRWSIVLRHALAWGIDHPDGGLAGTVTLCSYAGGPAVLGGMLVATDHERRGLGSRLVQHALAAADGPVLLYATAFGEPVYRRLGFVTAETMHVHIGSCPGTVRENRRDVTVDRPDNDNVARLIELDRAAGSGDRQVILSALAGTADARVVIHPSGRAAGLSYWSGDLLMVGPIIADSDDEAIDIAAALAAGAPHCRLDAATCQEALRDWCTSNGLDEDRTAPGMTFGAAGWEPSARRRTLASQGFG